MAEKICARCGRTFLSDHPQAKYCGHDCRLAVERARERERYYNRQLAESHKKAKRSASRKQKPLSLAEVSRAAHAAGMTYGNYVAKFGLK